MMSGLRESHFKQYLYVIVGTVDKTQIQNSTCQTEAFYEGLYLSGIDVFASIEAVFSTTTHSAPRNTAQIVYSVVTKCTQIDKIVQSLLFTKDSSIYAFMYTEGLLTAMSIEGCPLVESAENARRAWSRGLLPTDYYGTIHRRCEWILHHNYDGPSHNVYYESGYKRFFAQKWAFRNSQTQRRQTYFLLMTAPTQTKKPDAAADATTTVTTTIEHPALLKRLVMFYVDSLLLPTPPTQCISKDIIMHHGPDVISHSHPLLLCIHAFTTICPFEILVEILSEKVTRTNIGLYIIDPSGLTALQHMWGDVIAQHYNFPMNVIYTACAKTHRQLQSDDAKVECVRFSDSYTVSDDPNKCAVKDL